MPILASEIHFRKGLVALSGGDYVEAARHFKSAIAIERQRGVVSPQMRYLSYFGLASALAHGTTPEAIQACERAARTEFHNPELQLNLGRVYLMAGRTTKALVTFERGLRLDPHHQILREEFVRLDRRRSPILPFLGRSHPMNRWLGKMRHSMRGWTPSRFPLRRPVIPS